MLTIKYQKRMDANFQGTGHPVMMAICLVLSWACYISGVGMGFIDNLRQGLAHNMPFIQVAFMSFGGVFTILSYIAARKRKKK